VDVRASLEGSPGSYGLNDPMGGMGATMGGMGGDMMGGAMAMITARPTGAKGAGLPTAATTAGLEPGRVILGVLDASMVDYFKEQVGEGGGGEGGEGGCGMIILGEGAGGLGTCGLGTAREGGQRAGEGRAQVVSGWQGLDDSMVDYVKEQVKDGGRPGNKDSLLSGVN
jgi:hypothetical protein